MQFTLLARKRTTRYTVTTQYGTSNFKNAIKYAQRIYPEHEGFNEWEALECRCQNNGDYCEACQVLNIYRTVAEDTFNAERADGVI